MIKVVLLGCGERGRIYKEYMRSHPESYSIIAVADRADEDAEFRDWREALDKTAGKADAVIVALPDKDHFLAGRAALERGFHVLMEKPIALNRRELSRLRQTLLRNSRLMMPCYVLRYSSHYRKLAEILKLGVIGDIISIHHLNAISYAKTAANFCRGNWGRAEESGPIILTKCSHDIDLILSWLNYKEPDRVVSFGGHKLFSPENAPAGSTAECAHCKCSECVFKVDGEECVYTIGSDVADHQTTLFEYYGGPLVTFEMEAITAKRGRFTRFFGTKGTLLSDDADIQKITLRVFGRDEVIYDTTNPIHHDGGDEGVIEEFRRLVENHVGASEKNRLFAEAAMSHKLALIAEMRRETNARKVK